MGRMSYDELSVKLKEMFQEGYDAFEESRQEAQTILDLYHNRHYTEYQEDLLRQLRQPPETFNVIKMLTRHLVGYYSTTVNNIRAVPKDINSATTAALINDVLKYINTSQNYEMLMNRIKAEGFLTGLLVSYIDVEKEVDENGDVVKDEFGRPVYKVVKDFVPSNEIVLDPMSRRIDYSDARYIHRFKWVSREEVTRLFGKSKAEALENAQNHLNIHEADINAPKSSFDGVYYKSGMYLIVHTIYIDDDNNTWSVYWCGSEILRRSKINRKLTKFPYRVVKINVDESGAYYGIFKDVYHSQLVINQALLQIAILINSNKVFVQDGAVEDLDEFEKLYKRVNGIIPVSDLNGIRVESLSAEIKDQYIQIDQALQRIKQVIGVNDAILGMAYASDSGRKVKLQQNAAAVGLKYLDDILATFYRLDGLDTMLLVKQYYKATQFLRIADEYVGERWVALNMPLINPITGEYIYEPVIDPETGEEMYDPYGNVLVEPLNNADTDLQFSRYDIEVESVSYIDENEQIQVLIETILNGNAGQMLMTVNPQGYARIASLKVRATKTRYSQEIANIFEETAAMLAPQPQAQQTLGSAGGGSSQVGGLPNTQFTQDRLSTGAIDGNAN